MTTRFNLRHRVPVEPLSSERLTNIERGIVAGAADAARAPTRESRNLVPAFALATVLVLGAGLVGWQLRGGGETPAPIATSEPLLVKTLDSSSTIDIGDARITSSPATTYVVTRADGGVLVSLGGGRVGLEVGKRIGRAPLVVRAGDTDVVVVGTRFSVDYDAAKNLVDVRVTEGIVKVVHRNAEKQLVAGEAWTTERGLVALAALETHVDDIEIEVGDPPDVALKDRTAKVPDARIATNGATKPPRAGEVRSNTSKKPSLVDPSDPYVELKHAILRVKVLPPLKVDTTDPHAAIAEYQKTLTGPGASRALYSVAFVQHTKLNQPNGNAQALHTLDRYRSRFQDGEEYASALWLRVRILCSAKIDDTCRAAAHTYIAVSPGGKALEVAGKIIDTPR